LQFVQYSTVENLGNGDIRPYALQYPAGIVPVLSLHGAGDYDTVQKAVIL